MGDFTQGPWRCGGSMIGHVKTQDGALIAKANKLTSLTNLQANARLIAASPDMYNALWEAVELSDRTLPPSGRTAECQRVYDIVRAALAKAEGE